MNDIEKIVASFRKKRTPRRVLSTQEQEEIISQCDWLRTKLTSLVDSVREEERIYHQKNDLNAYQEARREIGEWAINKRRGEGISNLDIPFYDHGYNEAIYDLLEHLK